MSRHALALTFCLALTASEMPVRPSVFGVVITEGRPHISNDVQNDPLSVGEPPGHPDVRTFLGVPLQLGTEVIGMIGVANKRKGANQVAVAIDNAGLYQHQQEMIVRLQQRYRGCRKPRPHGLPPLPGQGQDVPPDQCPAGSPSRILVLPGHPA